MLLPTEAPAVRLLASRTPPVVTRIWLVPAANPATTLPPVLRTSPLSEIVRLLPEPLAPTWRLLALVQSEPLPVTMTLLLLPEALPPALEAGVKSWPPLVTINWLPAPALPMVRPMPELL